MVRFTQGGYPPDATPGDSTCCLTLLISQIRDEPISEGLHLFSPEENTRPTGEQVTSGPAMLIYNNLEVAALAF